MSTLMLCGHRANATMDGQPACAICAGIHAGATVVDPTQPDLSNRVARCGCGKERPSSEWERLAFFEYLGPGSRMARDRCANCGYSEIAHTQEETRTQKNVVTRGECPGFVPDGGWSYDRYYCGCHGWD